MLKKTSRIISVIFITVIIGITVQLPASAATKTFEQFIVSKLESFASTVDVTAYADGDITDENVEDKCEELLEKAREVMLNNPQLFFVNTSAKISSGYGPNASYTAYKITLNFKNVYTIKKSEYAAAKTKFDAAVDKAFAVVNNHMSDIEKALAFHDYLVLNCKYDYAAFTTYKNTGKDKASAHTAYATLVSGISVCEGYAKSYMLLMKKAGIETVCITGKGDGVDHMWNYVKLNKKWYHVDVTFDDPGENDKLGNVSHENLLISDTAVKKTKHSGWTLPSGYAKASSTTYDGYFWKKISSAFVNIGEDWYYVEGGVLKKYNFTSNKSATVKSVSATAKWKDWGNANSYWPGNYSKLAAYNGTLYYNKQDGVYSYNPSTKKEAKIVSAPSTGEIYGIRVNGNVIEYSVKKDPNAADSSIKTKTIK